MEGCQKREPTIFGPINMGEFAEYVYFKEGTWWIYENSATQIFDTVKVLESRRWMDTTNGIHTNQVIIKERYNIYTYSTTLDELYWYHEPGTSPDAVGANSSRYHLFCEKNGGITSGTSIRLFHPFNLDPGDGYTKCINEDTTITINSTVYSNVKIFYVEQDGTAYVDGFGNANVYYFWSKNVGIIMRKITAVGTTEWRLIKKNIIQ